MWQSIFLSKKKLKAKFIDWYASDVSEKLRNGTPLEDIKVNLNISVLKPMHARWMVEVLEDLGQDQAIIITDFNKAGILEAFAPEYTGADDY